MICTIGVGPSSNITRNIPRCRIPRCRGHIEPHQHCRRGSQPVGIRPGRTAAGLTPERLTHVAALHSRLVPTSPLSSARRVVYRAVGLVAGALGFKERSELNFWRDVWDKSLRDGNLWGERTLALCGDDVVADDYEGRRWQQARAEVVRVLDEAGISDPAFFEGKVVVDIGPGCVGFPDACPARLSIGVDPLAEAYAREGLLLDSEAIYLSLPAEGIPLVGGSVDVVVARNSLDHVSRPAVVIREVARLLAPGGDFIVNVDVEHPASLTEPHELTAAQLDAWLCEFEIVNRIEWDVPHADADGGKAPGHAIVIHARKHV